jgi:hypothetical protein
MLCLLWIACASVCVCVCVFLCISCVACFVFACSRVCWLFVWSVAFLHAVVFHSLFLVRWPKLKISQGRVADVQNLQVRGSVRLSLSRTLELSNSRTLRPLHSWCVDRHMFSWLICCFRVTFRCLLGCVCCCSFVFLFLFFFCSSCYRGKHIVIIECHSHALEDRGGRNCTSRPARPSRCCGRAVTLGNTTLTARR